MYALYVRFSIRLLYKRLYGAPYIRLLYTASIGRPIYGFYAKPPASGGSIISMISMKCFIFGFLRTAPIRQNRAFQQRPQQRFRQKNPPQE